MPSAPATSSRLSPRGKRLAIIGGVFAATVGVSAVLGKIIVAHTPFVVTLPGSAPVDSLTADCRAEFQQHAGQAQQAAGYIVYGRPASASTDEIDLCVGHIGTYERVIAWLPGSLTANHPALQTR